MSSTDSDVEILDTDSESDFEVIETVNGSCPCCGYEGELRYVSKDSGVEAEPSRKRKRRRSRSPGSLQFMDELLVAIGPPRSQVTPAEQPKPASVEQSKPIIKEETPSFTQKFFSDYPEYKYDPAGETMSQFQQMSQLFNWRRDNPDMQEAQQKLRIALTEDFNRIYGKDVNDLASWQSLCRVLQLPEVPDDLDRCREIVKNTFVNLVDLVDTRRTNKPVQHFETEAELRLYSRQEGKIFPRQEAYAGGLLKFLLRRILSGTGSPGNHGGSRRPRKRPRKGRL